MLKNFVERLMHNAYLLDDAGDGGAGGGGNADGTSGADNGGKPQLEDGNGGKKPVAEAPPAGRLEDDPRYKGMLKDLQKERTARQTYDADLKAAKAELETERKRIQALVGVNPKSQDEEEEAQVRARLERLYPWMKDLTADDIKAIRESKGRSQQIEAVQSQQNVAHATKMLGSLLSVAEKEMGGKLTPRQAKRLQEAYVAEAHQNPDFEQRHILGDPKLIDEFVAEFIEDFVKPGERRALADELGRQRRVPNSKDRSIVGSDNKPIDVTNDKAVEDMLVQGFRDRGGRFRKG